jgi:serine/threonine-protein kinase
MGEVFVVQHREIGNEFVAKVRRSHLNGDVRTLEQMRIEAQTLGALRHRHIVGIIAVGRTRDGRPFIVTERLHGRTVRQELVQRGRLPALEALAYTCQLLSALSATHAIGIVHRDIKPDNLFICEIAGRRLLKVLDFGIARVASPTSPVRPLPDDCRTNTGDVIGTPVWQSPEGAMGFRVDERADLYATALVLYTLLAGRGPFDHFQSDSRVLSAHVVEDPEPPSRYTQGPLPAELDRIILKALSKDPGARFQTATEFSNALLEVYESLQRAPGWLETTSFVHGAPVGSDLVEPSPGPSHEGVVSAPQDRSKNERPPNELEVPSVGEEPDVGASAYRSGTVDETEWPAGVPAPHSQRRGLFLAVIAFLIAGAATAWLVASFSGVS